MVWKIQLEKCGADKIVMTQSYPIEGWFLAELLQMAYVLSSGDAMSADVRRDMGQRIQAVINGRI